MFFFNRVPQIFHCSVSNPPRSLVAAAKTPHPRDSAKEIFTAAAEIAHAKFAKQVRSPAARRARRSASKLPKNRVPLRNSGIFRPGAGGGRGWVKSASRVVFA